MKVKSGVCPGQHTCVRERFSRLTAAQPEGAGPVEDHFPGSRTPRPNKLPLTTPAAHPALPIFAPLMDKSAGDVIPLLQQSLALSKSPRDLEPALIMGISSEN